MQGRVVNKQHRGEVRINPAELTAELAARRQVAENNAALLAQALQLMAQLAKVLGQIK